MLIVYECVNVSEPDRFALFSPKTTSIRSVPFHIVVEVIIQWLASDSANDAFMSCRQSIYYLGFSD